MNTERIEILEMVADKVITVEEAERLLQALDEGQRRLSAALSGGRVGRLHHGKVVESIGEILAGITPTVRNAVEEALSSHMNPETEVGHE